MKRILALSVIALSLLLVMEGYWRSHLEEMPSKMEPISMDYTNDYESISLVWIYEYDGIERAFYVKNSMETLLYKFLIMDTYIPARKINSQDGTQCLFVDQYSEYLLFEQGEVLKPVDQFEWLDGKYHASLYVIDQNAEIEGMFRDQKTYHVYDAYSLYPLHVDVSELKAFSSNWQQVELDEVMDDTYTKYWDTLFEIKEGKCTFSFNTGELIH